MSAAAQVKKNEGNNFFKEKKYKEAIQRYSEAIALDPSDVTFYSNRYVTSKSLVPSLIYM